MKSLDAKKKILHPLYQCEILAIKAAEIVEK